MATHVTACGQVGAEERGHTSRRARVVIGTVLFAELGIDRVALLGLHAPVESQYMCAVTQLWRLAEELGEIVDARAREKEHDNLHIAAAAGAAQRRQGAREVRELVLRLAHHVEVLQPSGRAGERVTAT